MEPITGICKRLMAAGLQLVFGLNGMTRAGYSAPLDWSVLLLFLY